MLPTFLEGRSLPRRGREARAWLTRDARCPVIGLVIASVAISIAFSLIVWAVVGCASRRHAAAEVAPDKEGAPDKPPAPVEPAGPS